jgi:hypothetical protein
LDRQGVGGRTIREVYLAAAKVVFGWAVENRKLVANPATGVTVRVPKRQKLRGASFTPAEVRTILQASLLRDQGRISPEHALARRWVPWLCAYSGARVGEIAQMRGSDIIQMEGIWVMRITPEAGSTKTCAARIVPLHAHLIEQGLLKVAERGGVGPLFYNPQKGEGQRAMRITRKLVSDWQNGCVSLGWMILTFNRTMGGGTFLRRLPAVPELHLKFEMRCRAMHLAVKVRLMANGLSKHWLTQSSGFRVLFQMQFREWIRRGAPIPS